MSNYPVSELPNKPLKNDARLSGGVGLGNTLVFIIEDEQHAEPQAGEFVSMAEAVLELKRRAALPWNQPPNLAPCANWRTCGRTYEVIEYDTSTTPWKELSRSPQLKVSASGIQWLSADNLK
jgi:hypothetical protein